MQDSPILIENGGWALFITTPVGRNHAKSMFDMAQANPDSWFSEISTVTDTGAISLEAVEQQRVEYHALFGEDAGDALIAQEYHCSFAAAVLGAFYGKELTAAEVNGQICQIDVNPDLPIHTAWDIGVDDPCAIWVFQVEPGRVNVIDYYESSGHGLPHYVEWLEQHGYRGGVDWWPHDGRVQEFGSGRTRAETMMSLNRYPRIVPAHKLMDGISAARQTIPHAYFDAARCAKGLEALREYKAEWDDDLRTFKRTPLHNWASHSADAWRYLSMAWREPMPELEKPDPIAELLRPRTLNEMMKQYIDEQLELGNEEPGDWSEFK